GWTLKKSDRAPSGRMADANSGPPDRAGRHAQETAAMSAATALIEGRRRLRRDGARRRSGESMRREAVSIPHIRSRARARRPQGRNKASTGPRKATPADAARSL